MTRSTHKGRHRRFEGLTLFAGLVVCSMVASLVQGACWIAHLLHSGYGFTLVVPASTWFRYHTSTVGLLLDTLIVGPWLIVVIWFWRGRKKSHDNAEPVAPPNRRPGSPVRMRRVDRTPDSQPTPVVGGGR